MRILILGGGGMLGHQLWRHLHKKHDVWITVRKPPSYYWPFGLFEAGRTMGDIDVDNGDVLEDVFREIQPETVINAIGIIKQLKAAQNPLSSLKINALLPHRLARLCAIGGARLLHFSTDCVFSGRKGNYTEGDISDAEDLYGRTKFLGELHDAHCLTLRSSIIGRELETQLGLIEWFLSQRGKKIQGFRRAVYSGVTTHEMARVVERVLSHNSELSGLWHVSSEPIDKFTLLTLAKSAFEWEGEIVPDDEVICDRSLDSTRFRSKTGYQPPSWPAMIEEMALEPKPLHRRALA